MADQVHNLYSFRFNPIKYGQIIQQLREEAGESTSSLAKRINETYDVVNNLQRGRGGLSFERAFKLCTALRIPMESFMRLMLKDEDIDFWDDILLYDLSNGKIVPMSDPKVSEVPNAVSDTVATVASVAAAIPFEPTSVQTSKEDTQAQLTRQASLYEAHIADLHAYIESLERTNKLLIDLLGRK